MNFELDEQYFRRLEEIAKSYDHTVPELLVKLAEFLVVVLPPDSEQGIDDAFNQIADLIPSQIVRTPERMTAQAQRRAILDLIAELDKLPVANPDDGFSADQHDDVIYRLDS